MSAAAWWDDPTAPTPALSEFLAEYEGDSNLWWRVGCGHHQNLFDEAMEEIERQKRLNELTAAVITDVVQLLTASRPGQPIDRDELGAALRGYP